MLVVICVFSVFLCDMFFFMCCFVVILSVERGDDVLYNFMRCNVEIFQFAIEIEVINPSIFQ